MTIELRTGTSRAPRREDYCTKIAACGPKDIPTPLWDAFLDKVTAEDRELQGYLQRVAGYCLTGEVSEHALFFFYGTGANGKGVFLGTLRGIWKDYATTAPMETFTETHGDRHPTELAHLRGARLVVAQETEQGRRWSEAKVKTLTGGDPITARYMRQDFFEFMPQFKLLIAGNHKPSLRSVDEAIRRRFHLIPFTVTIPLEERDHQLPEKLKAEWPGILQWAVKGCLEWQKIGLAPPAAVVTATEEYLKSEDAILSWVDECCDIGAKLWDSGKLLWQSWRNWCESARERPGTRKGFSQELARAGFEAKKESHVRGYIGLALRDRSSTEEG
jgi:putative DNA primase/helicase